MKQGEIYYILYSADTTGSEQNSGRPAIIVSNDAANKYSDVVEVVYLTTQPKKDLPTHVPINSSRYSSLALCEQITSVSVERVGDYMGSCTRDEWEAIKNALMASLGLESASMSDSNDVAVQTELNLYKKLYQELLERLVTR